MNGFDVTLCTPKELVYIHFPIADFPHKYRKKRRGESHPALKNVFHQIFLHRCPHLNQVPI